jgi:hypothetical protein
MAWTRHTLTSGHTRHCYGSAVKHCCARRRLTTSVACISRMHLYLHSTVYHGCIKTGLRLTRLNLSSAIYPRSVDRDLNSKEPRLDGVKITELISTTWSRDLRTEPQPFVPSEMTEKSDAVGYDLTSYPVHIPMQERLGHGARIQLRRHKNEAEINRATHSARQDWQRYIGPIDTFGNANPYHGNFVSLVLPFTQPDRVAVLAYLIECQSLHLRGP